MDAMDAVWLATSILAVAAAANICGKLGREMFANYRRTAAIRRQDAADRKASADRRAAEAAAEERFNFAAPFVAAAKFVAGGIVVAPAPDERGTIVTQDGVVLGRSSAALAEVEAALSARPEGTSHLRLDLSWNLLKLVHPTEQWWQTFVYYQFVAANPGWQEISTRGCECYGQDEWCACGGQGSYPSEPLPPPPVVS